LGSRTALVATIVCMVAATVTVWAGDRGELIRFFPGIGKSPVEIIPERRGARVIPDGKPDNTS
jgi:hypothetical protein